MMLATRKVLGACKNIEKAKVALLNNRVYSPLIRVHFLIYDPGSDSTVEKFFAEDSLTSNLRISQASMG